MTKDQPTALRLADELEETPFQSTRYEAAAELRRLHDLLGKANALARIRAEAIDKLHAENEALREALKLCMYLVHDGNQQGDEALAAAKAALARAGETK